MNNMVVAHIGLMKTGSTSLQDYVLNDRRILSRIHDPRYFSRNSEDKELFDGTLFVSNENLSRVYNRVSSLKESIENIESYHTVDKYLLVFRNQFQFLESCYKHHIKQTYDALTFKQWLAHDAGKSQLELCYFDQLIDDIENIVGKQKVQVLFFEEMIRDESKFLSEFYQILDLTIPNNDGLPRSNERFYKSYYPAKLKFNSIFGKRKSLRNSLLERVFIKVMMRLRTKELEDWTLISSEEKDRLKADFISQNKKLADRFGYDLNKLNYLC